MLWLLTMCTGIKEWCLTVKCIKFSAEDMAKFVDNYPEYRKMHGNVSKHVTLVTEMSKIVEKRKLMLVSQTEQELACNGGQVAAFEVVWRCYCVLTTSIKLSYLMIYLMRLKNTLLLFM